MKFRNILLYALGVGLLLFGNRSFWDNLQEAKEEAKRQKELADANKGLEKRFETQKLVFDSVSGKWKNPQPYFQVVNLGNLNFKALSKGKTRVESNDDENASESI